MSMGPVGPRTEYHPGFGTQLSSKQLTDISPRGCHSERFIVEERRLKTVYSYIYLIYPETHNASHLNYNFYVIKHILTVFQCTLRVCLLRSVLWTSYNDYTIQYITKKSLSDGKQNASTVLIDIWTRSTPTLHYCLHTKQTSSPRRFQCASDKESCRSGTCGTRGGRRDRYTSRARRVPSLARRSWRSCWLHMG
jgi:hypothetical protein